MINKVRVLRGACCHGTPLHRRRCLRVVSPRLAGVTAQMMTLEESVSVGEDSEQGCPCVQRVGVGLVVDVKGENLNGCHIGSIVSSSSSSVLGD